MRSLFVAAMIVGTAAVAAAQTASWSYEGKNGPVNWGRLDAANKACSEGKQQSPIDIRGAHLDKTLPPVEYHYISGPVTIENTGRAIVAHVNRGSFMVVGGVRYELQYFAFHHPSEHAVKGKLTDMDVELVHKSEDGKQAVIAVRFVMDRGEANTVIAALWPHLPASAGGTAKVADMINPGGFLPNDRGYWTYTGSLTEPPCTEGVRWIVYEDPISVSLEQLKAYRNMFRISSRPLQDTHGRRIEANE